MYIVLEGIVGSGKSTQSKRLVSYFTSLFPEKEVLLVREPGSTPIAEDIRHLAQKKEWANEVMHPLTNAYLYAAARAQLLHTIVKPALESGKIVISDRSFLSSLAQQGFAQGLWIETVLSINESAIAGILPDRVFYLDIDSKLALDRSFDHHGDKWEKMEHSFFDAIIDGYEKCEKLEIMKNRYIHIDARGSEDEVFQRIQSVIIWIL